MRFFYEFILHELMCLIKSNLIKHAERTQISKDLKLNTRMIQENAIAE